MRQAHRAEQRPEDSELGSRAEHQRPWIGEQGSKIRERADPHEYEQRENRSIHPNQVDQVQYPVPGRDLHTRNVGQNAAEADRDQQ